MIALRSQPILWWLLRVAPRRGTGLRQRHDPVEFRARDYNGIDAFIFVDTAGKRQPFRFKIAPVTGEEHLSGQDAAKLAPNALMDEIATRLAKTPVSFHLLAQLANAGDQTKDPTRAWPDDRKLVDLGTITLDKADADSKTAEKQLLFLPSNRTDGIEMSDDPLVDARNQAYAISFGRRTQ